MIFVVFVLLFASSILALPTSSCLSSLVPSRQSFNQPPPFPMALRSTPPEPSQTTPNHQVNFRSKSAQRNMFIALSTIGGSILLGFLIAIIRCICRYQHPPKRDRIAEAIDRHNLQLEMEELARNPYALRDRPSHREPAPPYAPRPPSYSESLLREGGTNRCDSATRNLLPNTPSSSGFPINIR